MSAIVCRKRSNSIFDELLHTPPLVSKRIRCSASASSSPIAAAVQFSSPPRPSSNSPSFNHNENSANNNISGSSYLSHLLCLRSLFPDMDQQCLERELEASGNDLDSAIRSLNDLRLELAENKLGFAASKSDSGLETNVQQIEGSENQSVTVNLPTDGSEWVNLFVREMMNATDVDDARACASRLLEVLEKSITTRVGAEATQSFHKENIMLKEQVEVLLQENTVLKRAVAIQHERQKEQKEYNGIGEELQHLKQLVSHYQEQLKTLEINNYALTIHLRQAQQSSSIPGRFHPDIF